MGADITDTSRSELGILTRYLEAELAGQPVDLSQIKELADRLGQSCPSIQKSMALLQQRVMAETNHT